MSDEPDALAPHIPPEPEVIDRHALLIGRKAS
jgi:hypothetical protein